MKQILLSWYFHFFGFLARFFLKKHKPVVIGVTGSIGKTSCRMLISEILVQSFPHKIISTSSKNFNGELGMSLSVLGISDYTPTPLGVLKTVGKAITRAFFVQKMYDVIFLEYGIDHVGEMDFMLSIAHPEIGIVTKIDAVHSSQFQNTDITAFEKYKLLQETSHRAYLNMDDPYAKIFKDSIIAKKRFYTTSSSSPSVGDVGGKDFTLFVKDSLAFSRFAFWCDGVSRFEVVSNSLGQENMGYISIGYDIVEYLGNKFYGSSFLQQISSSQELHFILQASRFSIFEGIGGSVLIDSTYNASPKSMDVVIENTLQLHTELYPDFELLFVLGEMRELGDYAQSAHEQLAEKIASMTQEVWCVGKDMERYFLPAFGKKGGQAKMYKNSFILGYELAEFLRTSEKKYLVLFKGSQNTIFLEEAVKACLTHTDDIKKICRQESFWMEKKHNFFCE